MFGYQYDRTGDTCSGGPQPGAVALLRVVLSLFDRLYSLGIYNCRPVRGGTALSTHAEGRACDFGVHVATPASVEQGDALAAELVRLAPVLGVQEVIWQRRRWTSTTRAWNAYGGTDPHNGHVHVALCWAAARQLDAATVTRAFGAPLPAPPPQPPQEYAVPPTLDLRTPGARASAPPHAVAKMQALITAQGHPLVIDGKAGEATAWGVLWWQKRCGLVTDGVCGPVTWRALIER